MDNIASARRTKIVCTLGPASQSPEMVRALILAGMNVVRLNFSHGDHESHGRSIRIIREVARELGREIGVLMDLAGPKIRLGELPERRLETGAQVVMRPGERAAGDDIPVNYPYLLEDVVEGARILLADGKVELAVEGCHDGALICRVMVGGVLSSHKGVNLPTSDLRIPAFTEKDRQDLAHGLAQGVDFVAMSFIRHERDLVDAREMMDGMERPPLLIAKIEKPQALDRLMEILAAVDGVMVARGDLGVEMPVEEVPIIQKRIIEEARRSGRVVITATQMLGSMVANPRPSRAEVTDVANAILDGTDAVMLSEETATGQFPVEAVQVLDKVARYTEPELHESRFLKEDLSPLLPHAEAAITRAVGWLAQDVPAVAIVAATFSGLTGRLMARLRPARPVLGLTAHQRTCRQLCLSWGVIPILIPPCHTVDELAVAARLCLKNLGMARRGDHLILTAGVPLQQPGSTNLIKVVEVA